MARALPLHGEMPEPAAPASLGLARKGFRPFFLLAAAFACAIVPLWIMVVAGVVRPGAYLDAPSWHAHEMVFGFAVAVIAGFLLTAVGNWTQRETLVGRPLLALAALWVAGRVVMAAPGLFPRGIPAVIDLAFLPVLVVVLARPLVAAKNRRNFVMLAILGALFAANVAVHLGALGVLSPGAAKSACLVGIDVVTLVVVIIAGRVFPMFTKNATGVETIQSIPALDIAAAAAMALLTVVSLFGRDGALASALAVAAGLLGAARAARWTTVRAARIPLVWILHTGYAWLCLGLLLRGVAGFVPVIPASVATHMVTVGGLGSLTLGMMARVSLGHTGRPLEPPAPVVGAFWLVTAAAFVRVAVPLVMPGQYLHGLVVAAALWACAFLLYVVAYARLLWSPRLDGKPG